MNDLLRTLTLSASVIPTFFLVTVLGAAPDLDRIDARVAPDAPPNSPVGSAQTNPGHVGADVGDERGHPKLPGVLPLDSTYHLQALTIKLQYQPMGSTAVAFQSQNVALSFDGDWDVSGPGTDENTATLLLDLEPPEIDVDSQTSDPISGTYTLDGGCRLGGLNGESVAGNVSPDLERVHAVAGFDESGESGRGLFIGLAGASSLTVDSVSGRYRFFGLEGQLTAQPQSTGIGARGQIVTVDLDAGDFSSAGTFEETARLNLDETTPTLDVSSQQSSPSSGTYTVTPTGEISFDGSPIGRVSPDGDTIVVEDTFDEPGSVGRGLLIGMREGSGLSDATLDGIYRFHGLAAKLSEQPTSFAVQSQSVDLSFDGAGGFDDGGTTEETATLNLDGAPPTIELRSEITAAGSGTYTVGATGQLTLSAGTDTLDGWVSPDGDTIVLFGKRDDSSESARALYMGTRSLCDEGFDELATDFGASGLWHYHDGAWTRLTSWDAEVVQAWGRKLAAGFGGDRGLWIYDSDGWTRLTTWDPEIIADWGAKLAIDFGNGRGLWLYEPAGWTRLSTWDAVELDVMGDQLCAAFGAGRGLWCSDAVGWTRLATWDPDESEPVNLE